MSVAEHLLLLFLPDILHAAETWTPESGDRMGSAVTGQLCATVSIVCVTGGVYAGVKTKCCQCAVAVEGDIATV